MFLWPWVLVLLLLLPGCIWYYRNRLKFSAKSVILFPETPLLSQINSPKSWRKHLPALTYTGACILALIAMARPTLPVPAIAPQSGIILALDVSRSMRNTDISPSRFEAARAAIRSFVEGLPEGARVGLVTFGGYARLAVPLTTNHDDLLREVDYLSMIRGTAIGDGLLESLAALPELETRQNTGEDPQRLATIILLSDGRNRNGTDPLEALDDLRQQQVTVHTVGVGSVGASDFGGWSGFDEDTLQTIANETGGEYFFVDSAAKLQEVYQQLGAFVTTWKRDEVAALGALAAACLLCLSIVGSQVQRKIL